MTTTHFQQPEDVAVPVANDGPAGARRATVQTLPAASAVVTSRNGAIETMLFVEAGVIEIAIDGMNGHLKAGAYARIAPGAHFAYRNSGNMPARVLIVPMVRTGRALRLIRNDTNVA